jgi:hypothetical protein
MEQRKRFAVPLRIGRGIGFGRLDRPLDLTQLAIAVQHELDRRQRHRWSLLRHMRDRPRGRQLHAPRILVQFAENQREQARLAGAVRSDEADLVAGVDRQVRAVQQALRAAGKDEVREAQQLGPVQTMSAKRVASITAACSRSR